MSVRNIKHGRSYSPSQQFSTLATEAALLECVFSQQNVSIPNIEVTNDEIPPPFSQPRSDTSDPHTLVILATDDDALVSHPEEVICYQII